MSLRLCRPRYGNFKLVDVRSRVNVHSFTKYFNTLPNVNTHIPLHPPLETVLDIFGEYADVKESVAVTRERITAAPFLRDWHRNGVSVTGILCVNRESVDGGHCELVMPGADPHSKFFTHLLWPGDFLIFDDPVLFHRITPVTPEDASPYGYMDLLYITTPGTGESCSL